MEKELRIELKNMQDTLHSEDNVTEAEIKAGNTKEKKLPKENPDTKRDKKDLILPGDQRKQTLNKKDTVRR
ncbi:MAG: hypothetical protein IPO53_06265 [Chitinophagaceae bacterium]|nr:hypothetical protein [Chitinophagaceae bacterium]